MAELLTAAQMRAIEQAAIESGAVTGLELMERAGRGVVEAVFEEWPELAATSHRAVVLCGPGNNGGDGFVVARLLKVWGWEVEVFLYGDPDKLPPDARVNYERWRELGEVQELPGPDKPHNPWASALIVDALFGTGLTRGLSMGEGFGGMLPDWDLRLEPERPRIVAVDIPSGLCSDSGRELEGDGLWADLTVSFHTPKLGHVLARGPFCSTKVVVKDIGLVPSTQEAVEPDTSLVAASRSWTFAVTSIQDASLRKSDPFGSATHKYSHGHALILSGPSGQTGAARLAARGALRIGAGLVTLGAPEEARVEIAAQTTAIMQRQMDGAGELEAILQDTRFNAVCLGPGLGVERARELVPVAVRAEHAPCVVLDADALTAFADAPETLFALCSAHRSVLTPHAGEFARLFPDIAEKLNATPTTGPAYSKVDATREAAKRANAVVLFKGPDTVIADPKGRASVNSAHYDRAAPWLATAGSGDVLAGFITGLLARGLAPMQAAETAAWLHVECARNFGPGLIAEDLPEELPAVFRKLGL